MNLAKGISFLIFIALPVTIFGSQESSQNREIGYSKEQGLIKAQQLVKFFTSLSEAGSQGNTQNKKISYSKGQGLSFDFPSDPKEQQIKAQEIVKSLHNQNLTTGDVFKDYLEQKKVLVNKALAEAMNESTSLPKCFGSSIHEAINISLEVIKKDFSRKAEITFKDSFNENVQQLVRQSFKQVEVPYSIVVRRFDGSRDFNARIVTERSPEKNLIFLDLPWHLWGDDKGCKNIAKNKPEKSASILLHEATHAKQEHGLREGAIISLLEKAGCEKKKIEEITTHMDTLSEREADLLPFINNSTSHCMVHRFRKIIEKKSLRPKEYLPLDELSKIITLHDAERSILTRRERWERDKETWTNAIEATFARNGVSSLLYSSFIPCHMKLYALSKMPEAISRKFL